MNMGTAYTTTVGYDASGNSYQLMYPLYTATVPYPQHDTRGFEIIPHRIFVGGFPVATTELELRTFFEQYGHVREAKVIRSSEGTSKGYGFITFDSEEEAKAIMQTTSESADNKLEFKGRRLNIGPAVRRIYSHFPQANPLPGFTYTYPQQQMVMVQQQPTHYSSSFIYSPATPALAQTQFNFPAVEGNEYRIYQQQQQPLGGGGSIVGGLARTAVTSTPQESPQSNGTDKQQPTKTANAVPVVINPQTAIHQQYYPQSSGVQHLMQMGQPLTPITPSAVNPRVTVAPQTYMAQQQTNLSELFHYPQVAPQAYYCPTNGPYQAFDGSGQPMTITSQQFIPQTAINPQNVSVQYLDETANAVAWQANSNEARHMNNSGRNLNSPAVALSNRFKQMNLQQPQQTSPDRKDGQQRNASGGQGPSKGF